METIHVLVVDADPATVGRVQLALRSDPGALRHYHVEMTSDFIEAEKALVRNLHDVFLLDYNVPNSPLSAMDLLKRVNAGGCCSPVLILSTVPDEIIEAQVEEAGAAGFLNKNQDLVERVLKHAVWYATRQYKQLLEVREQLASLVAEVAQLNRKLTRR